MTQQPTGKAGKVNGWSIYATGAAVCAAVTAGAYLLGVQPALARRDAAAAATAELQDRRRQAADLARDLAAARRQLADANRDVAGLSLRLEPPAALNQRLARLADLAAESGLSLDEIQPGGAEDGPHYQTVPIRIVGGGRYPACAAFLHRLRERFPDTSVRAFDLTNANPLREESPTVFRAELVWHTAPVRK